MSNSFNFLTGAGIGAGLMYLMDPDRGNRRRMLVRDQTVHGLHLGARAADKAVRDLQNRARGTVAEAWAAFRREELPDAVIAERVRARLGRLVSHPNSIEVTAQQGRVTLSGPVLEHEVRELISRVRSIRGVRDVNNRLDIHKQPGNVPGLQGGSGRTGQRIELLQENWAPGTRLLVGAAGLMAIAGARGRGIIKTPLALAGAGMLLRAATNLPLRRSLGLDGSRRGVEFQKTIHIAAPIEEVCAVWCHPENFPRVMSHVKDVRKVGDNHYHWVVSGPGGVSVGWDAVVTQFIPNQVLAWSSVPGASVRHAGIVRFDREDSGTRLHIRMSYNPPGGTLGHLLAATFGADPKSAMDDDLARFKSVMEEGKTRAHGERVRRDELTA